MILSWHGVFTFIAVAVAVYLVVRWGTREGMAADVLYTAAMWCIIGGVIGARLLHVIDYWDEVYSRDFVRVFQVWQGGIAIFGAISGGFVGGSLYLLIRNSDWFLAIWRPFFAHIRPAAEGRSPYHRASGGHRGAGSFDYHGHWPYR